MLGSYNRRDFLKTLGLTTAGSLIVPSYLKANAPLLSKNGKRLVVIQLSGGNDGLNTVVPYRDDSLYQARPDLAPVRRELLEVTDEVGFNNKMVGFQSLFNDGETCIIHNVGYPNPNRSHFRSMDIWHSASDSDQYVNTGWIGRYLDSECTPDDQISAVEISNVLSLAMKGALYKGLPVTDIQQFYRNAKLVENASYTGENGAAAFLYKTMADIKSSAAYLYEKQKISRSRKDYPDEVFANQLKQVAEMILSGIESPVYYVSLSGFDTHNRQAGRQGRLLGIYSDALKVFVDDLKQNGEWNNTLVMTFSEFGRRVKQNASGGTDHGKANNLFLHGGNLSSAGIYNDLPDLTQLDEGDLAHKIDFRQVYGTILDRWFEVNHSRILGRAFDSLDFI